MIVETWWKKTEKKTNRGLSSDSEGDAPVCLEVAVCISKSVLSAGQVYSWPFYTAHFLLSHSSQHKAAEEVLLLQELLANTSAAPGLTQLFASVPPQPDSQSRWTVRGGPKWIIDSQFSDEAGHLRQAKISHCYSWQMGGSCQRKERSRGGSDVSSLQIHIALFAPNIHLTFHPGTHASDTVHSFTE